MIAALLAAIRSAYGSGDTLAYTGIAFYLVCITALIINHHRTGRLLLFAVAVHFGLTGYAIWRWQFMGITPCHYCLLAAGFALVAAVWWVWPFVFVGAAASSLTPATESTETPHPPSSMSNKNWRKSGRSRHLSRSLKKRSKKAR